MSTPHLDEATPLLDALFEHSPVGLAFWDTAVRYRRINAALAGMNGVAVEDHIGRRPSEVLGALGEELEVMLERVLRTGESIIDGEVHGQTPAAPGHARTWLASYYPVPGADGEPAGIGAVVLEVTAERRATERARTAIRERRTTSALLDAIFAAAPVGIAFWDRDLRCRRINEALAAMNGVAVEDHIGRRPDEILGPYGDVVIATLTEVAETRRTIIDREIETPLGPAGAPQFRQVTVFPVDAADGELAGLAAVVRDVTSQHEAEAERVRLLRDALTARAAAEAAQVRAEAARQDAERARRNTEVLARAGERLAAVSRDYEQTLQEVAHVAVPMFADWCLFTLRGRRSTLRTVAVAAREPQDEADLRALFEREPLDLDGPSITAEVLRTGRPRLLERLTPDALEETVEHRHRALLARLGLGSAIVVPLTARGRPIGALTLVHDGSGRLYGPDDLRLAESLGARAALAVENARLYSERSHIAQTLQRSLLPPALPEVPGLELAAGYRAAGDQNDVGGDFYDAFRTTDGTWTFLIGDVSGKGAEAAALTSLTRHTLRAASLRTLDPIENLELLNDALWSQTDLSGRFCTVLYAQVRPDAHGAEVSLATGGHLPPIVLRAGGRLERIQLRGAIVGGLRRPQFGERRVRLDHGDLLLLFTDGLVELRGPGGNWDGTGDQALEDTLRALRGASAADVVAAVEARAVELQAGEPRDDIAVLALRPRA